MKRARKVRRIVLGRGWRDIEHHCSVERIVDYTRFCVALEDRRPMVESRKYKRCTLVLEVEKPRARKR